MAVFFIERSYMKGSKYLLVSSILEIVIGLVSLFTVWSLVGSGDFSKIVADGLAGSALLSIVVVYGYHIYEIFAGIVGLIKHNKRSVFVCIVGFILFLINLTEFIAIKGDMINIIIHVITFIVPGLYILGAYQNLKGK